MGQAFKEILETLLKSKQTVSIMNYGSNKSLIGSIIQGNANLIPLEVENLDNNKIVIENKYSAIMLFSSVESLIKFNSEVTFTNRYALPMLLNYVVYCLGATFEQVSKLEEKKKYFNQNISYNTFKSLDRTEILHFQYFLIEEINVFRLLTFVWYTPQKCNEPQLIEVNRFDKITSKWNSSTFKITKFHNFHGCELVFGVVNQTAAFLAFRNPDSSFRYEGFNHEIIKSLAKHLNYTYFFNPYFGSSWFYENEVDVVIQIGCQNENVMLTRGHTCITQTFKIYYNFMAVPPGEEYNGYEKILLPFDEQTWALIILTFCFSYLVNFFLYFMKKNARDFIFGSNVSSPSLNIASAFFGIGQATLPRRNFARFLLMMFIIYSLIIRNAWQGQMFKFMQQYMTKPEVQSIEELIEKNFSFYMFDQFSYYFNGSDIVAR